MIDLDDITARDGLLYRGDEIVDAIEADEIARRHGYQFAEDYVRALCAGPEYDPNVVVFVRIERSVRDKMADESERRGVSLNRLCGNLFKQWLAGIDRAQDTQSHQVSPSLTKPHQVSPSLTKSHQASPSLTKVQHAD